MKLARIIKFVFIPTGSYHDLAIRPYAIDQARPLDMERMYRATDEFRDLSASALVGTATSILRPIAAPAGTVHMENGWRQKRYMFMLEIEHTQDYDATDASTRVQYITGWTGYADPSFSGLIDPDMPMFLDTVINTREIRQGNQVYRRGIGAQYFLASSGRDSGASQSRSMGRWAMRPRDVVNQVGNEGFDMGVVNDYRNNLMSRPVLSNVRNNLPADYLSRTTQSYKTVVNGMNTELTDLPEVMYQAGNLTEDGASVDDVLILELMRNTNLVEGQSMTYSQFCALFPEADSLSYVADEAGPMTQDIGFATHQTTDTENWNSSSLETLTATILAQALPALMHMHLLTHVSFFITNDTIDGQVKFEWLSKPASFMNTGVSLDRYADAFIGRLIHEVFRGATRDGNMLVTCSIFSDLIYADTRIRLSVDNGPEYEYAPPNFAGSLMSPVVANQNQQVEVLSSSIGSIFRGMRPSQITIPEPDKFGESFTAGGASSLRSVLRDREQAPVAPASTGTWKL